MSPACTLTTLHRSLVSTSVSPSVFPTVQRDIGPGAADQAEAAGPSGSGQVKTSGPRCGSILLLHFNAYFQKKISPVYLRHACAGQRGSKSPDQLQLRTRWEPREASPPPAPVPAVLFASFSPSGPSSASTTGRCPSRSGRSSPASPRVSATRRTRSRCSGEPIAVDAPAEVMAIE